jgi:hypothetical protein
MVRGFKKCCISDEVGNGGSEHEARWGCEDTEAETADRNGE